MQRSCLTTRTCSKPQTFFDCFSFKCHFFVAVFNLPSSHYSPCVDSSTMIFITNSYFFCSMMLACFTGHVNVAITLKEHGASLSVKDQGGIWRKSYALKHERLYKFLLRISDGFFYCFAKALLTKTWDLHSLKRYKQNFGDILSEDLSLGRW